MAPRTTGHRVLLKRLNSWTDPSRVQTVADWTMATVNNIMQHCSAAAAPHVLGRVEPHRDYSAGSSTGRLGDPVDLSSVNDAEPPLPALRGFD